MKQIKVYDNQTIIDVINNKVGNLDCLYSSLVLNNLTSLDDILDINVPINYEESWVKKIEKTLNYPGKNLYKNTFDNQSTFDVYLQFNGNFDGFYGFLNVNKFDYNKDLNLENVIIESKYRTITNDVKYSTKVGYTLTNYLLLEDNSYVLLENNYKIIIN